MKEVPPTLLLDTLEKGQTVSPIEFEDVKLEWW
jgi:hypothetical protein